VELTNVVIRGEDVDNDAIEWRINGTLTLKSAQLLATKIDIEAGGGFRMDEPSVIDVSARVIDMKTPGAGSNST
jgi:hypothetical protein